MTVYTTDEGPQRLFAEVEVDGRAGVFLVDTGANESFISTPDLPDGTPDVGTVSLGCETFSPIGRPFSAAEEQSIAGAPVLGFLGSDWFLSQPTRIDIEAARIERLETAPGLGHAVPIHNVFDFLFIDVEIDGTPLELGFDTGAPHTLWIGVHGRPGDIPVQSQDGFGDPITYHLGDGELNTGNGVVEVPVMRVRHHPSIEAGDAQLGIHVDGLFGLTSIPNGSVLIDGDTLWLE